MEALQKVLQTCISTQIIPGAIVAVQKGSQDPEYLSLGVDGGGHPMTDDMLFPLASVTKLATALAVLRLVAAGRLGLDDALDDYLPQAEAARRAPRRISVRALLCHTSGLPEDVPPGAAPYAMGLDWPTIAAACLATPPQMAPWSGLLYSNVGVSLLALLVERITGQTFPQAVEELALAPLDIEGYLGEEPARRPAVIGGKIGHKGTPIEWLNSAFWRSLALPYAGLVTHAKGALRLVRAFAGDPAGFLPADLLAEARRDQTRGLPGSVAGIFKWEKAPWGLGIELRGRKEGHPVAAEAAPESFGHLGSSGAIAWYEPQRDLVWVILGPRLFGEWYKDMPLISTAILKNV